MKDAITLAGSTILAAMADLEGQLRAKGYQTKIDHLSIGGVGPFWLTVTAREAEYFYGPDLGECVARAERWIESLPIENREARTRALAPWFELAQ